MKRKATKRKKPSEYVRISRNEYNSLREQITFWSKRFDEQLTRTNELTNSLLMTNGLPAPVPRDRDTSGMDHLPPALRDIAMRVPELLAETIEDTLETEPAEAEV